MKANRKGVIKQHYVPQFYLERFTTNGEKLFVYDKPFRKVYPANKKDVAQERYFYDIPPEAFNISIPGLNFDPQLEEKALQALEGKFAQAIDELLNVTDNKGSYQDLRINTALGVAMQLIRTRKYRNYLIEIMTKGQQAILDAKLKVERPDLAEVLRAEVKYDKDMAAILHAKSMWNVDLITGIANTFYHHLWFLGENDTPQPLYTSDNPVIVLCHKENKPELTATEYPVDGIEVVLESHIPGLGSEGLEILLPLTPKHILIFLERKFFHHLEKSDGTRIQLRPEEVKRYNSLQVIESHRQIYCPDTSFALAEKICKEHPEVCSLESNKVSVNLIEKKGTGS